MNLSSNQRPVPLPSQSNPRTVALLGITVQPLTEEQLTDLVGQEIALQRQSVVANHNLHSLALFHRDERFRQFYDRARYTHIDGMPIVALARWFGFTVSREERVTYADWITPLMNAAAQNQWRVFYLGSRPGIAEAGAQKLRERFQTLKIKTRHGFFQAAGGSEENESILREIAEYQPQVLMIGMGMPRQELWILQNLERLPAAVILPSGAAIDYVAGAVPTPPRWAGKCGLEWAFRLAAEPRRLWHRYLIEPWSLLGLALRYYIKEHFAPRRTAEPKE